MALVDFRSLGSVLSKLTGWSFLSATGNTGGPTSINDLPVEILGEIFLICALHDNPWPFFDLSRQCNRRAPIKLTHVCRLWRFIGLSLPPLWASFNLGYVNPGAAQDALAIEFLQRSGQAPLQLDLSPPSSSETVLSAMLSQAHRLNILRLPAEGRAMDQFISLPSEATPALKGLAITSKPGQASTALPSLAVKMTTMSFLQQVHLNLLVPSYDDFLSHIPFEQMTHIKLEGDLAFRDFISVVGRCTNATYISMKTIREPLPGLPWPSLRQNPIELPRLKYLTLETWAPIASLLTLLSCPSLGRLHLLTVSTCDQDYPTLCNFVKDIQLEQIIVCIVGGYWVSAKEYLKLDRTRTQNLEIRMVNPNEGYKHQVPDEGYRCPRSQCTLPHLGWSTTTDHLGTPLPVAEWEEPFWDSPYVDDHETLEWSWVTVMDNYVGFC